MHLSHGDNSAHHLHHPLAVPETQSTIAGDATLPTGHQTVKDSQTAQSASDAAHSAAKTAGSTSLQTHPTTTQQTQLKEHSVTP